MAAGQGFKTFTTGEVLTAGDVNGYLMQGVLVFASAAARNAAITSPQEGQFAFTKDTNGLWYYDGAAWVASGATGDIEGVTAGVGITGGGTSGTVTITNDMATTITASGDIVVGTGSGTYDNLPIGTTGQLLTADTTVSPYKVKWATPAAAASGLTYLAGGSVTSVSSISLATNIISSTYPFYRLFVNFTDPLSAGDILLRARASGSDYTSTNYYGGGKIVEFSGTNTDLTTNSGSGWNLKGPSERIGYSIDLIGWHTSKPKIVASGVFSGSAQGGGTFGGFLLAGSTFDSLSLVTASGTFTCTYRFYGFANS